MLRIALFILLFTGAALAIERSPAPERPPGRELTAMEQFERSEEGQELDRVIDFIMSGDAEAAERAIQAYRKKYNITTPIGTIPPDSQPELPKIKLR